MTLKEQNELKYLDTLIKHDTSHSFEKAIVQVIGIDEFREIHDRFKASHYIEYKNLEYQQPEENIIGKQQAIRLTPSGKNYHSFLNEKKENENLEMQQLRTNNALLVEQLSDYRKVKSHRETLLIVAIIELLAIIVLGILQSKCL